MITVGENLIQETLVWWRDTLKYDPWYAEHGIAILIENQKDILYETEKVIGASTGCIVVLKNTRATNNRPAINLTLELMVLENPVANRNRANAATALDVAWHAAMALDGPAMMLRDIEHTEVDNLFQARATFECMITRSADVQL